MLTLITVIHLLISVSLIGAVLLQDPKGGAMGMLGGGGGSQSVFGATGASTFLTSATKWLAISFGITCILLTYFTSHSTKSVTDSVIPAATAPAVPGATPEAGTPATPATETAPTESAAPAADATAPKK
ncbi:MAG: preprotein translocase subunit SecG [Bdellovibrionota bacterium]